MNKKQVFLLPFAGGNQYSYRFLEPLFDQTYELIPLELPGRGGRMGEELITDINLAVDDYLEQVKKKKNGAEYLIYGHSMGASLGFYLCGLLEKKMSPPRLLFVSGSSGPLKTSNKLHPAMEDNQLKENLVSMGGIPEEIAKNPEFLDFYLPILRADLQVLYPKELPEYPSRISTPICALMGSEEEKAKDINNWQNCSAAEVETGILPGNHFFVYKQAGFIAEKIKSVL